MIDSENFCFEHHQSKNCKNNQSNDLLNHLQLNQRKRTSVFFISNSICRHLKSIFKERNAQLIKMMEIKPSLLNHFHSENFKCPYHAIIMNELLMIKSVIVKSAFMLTSVFTKPLPNHRIQNLFAIDQIFLSRFHLELHKRQLVFSYPLAIESLYLWFESRLNPASVHW